MKFLIIILLILTQCTVNAQGSANAGISDSLLSLELLYWQSSSDSAKTVLVLEKSRLYKGNKMHKEAVKELERTKAHIVNDSIRSVVNYEKLLNHFLNADYGYCTDIVIEPENLNRIGRKKEYTLMRLQALAESERWQQCKEELMAASCCNDSVYMIGIQCLPEGYNYVSPEYCSRLSSYLPGLGAIKAGYPVKGITSFVIQAGLVAFTGYNFYMGYNVTATVSGIFPFLKFYSGGKRLGQRLADKHNQKEKNILKQRYTEAISKAVYKTPV